MYSNVKKPVSIFLVQFFQTTAINGESNVGIAKNDALIFPHQLVDRFGELLFEFKFLYGSVIYELYHSLHPLQLPVKIGYALFYQLYRLM